MWTWDKEYFQKLDKPLAPPSWLCPEESAFSGLRCPANPIDHAGGISIHTSVVSLPEAEAGNRAGRDGAEDRLADDLAQPSALQDPDSRTPVPSPVPGAAARPGRGGAAGLPRGTCFQLSSPLFKGVFYDNPATAC